jgi:hypothetical protein
MRAELAGSQLLTLRIVQPGCCLRGDMISQVNIRAHFGASHMLSDVWLLPWKTSVPLELLDVQSHYDALSCLSFKATAVCRYACIAYWHADTAALTV